MLESCPLGPLVSIDSPMRQASEPMRSMDDTGLWRKVLAAGALEDLEDARHWHTCDLNLCSAESRDVVSVSHLRFGKLYCDNSDSRLCLARSSLEKARLHLYPRML